MRLILLLFAMLLPGLAAAQAPASARPHPDLPSATEPARRVPTTGYTLALSWGPEYCYTHRDQAAAECADRGARGFRLHGLWPEGAGPDLWPQYCHPVAILTDAQIKASEAVTPSAQLLQHEWAKHGSCTGNDPAAFFAEEGRLFASVRSPDMATLAHRRGLTAGAFRSAFAAANPGMRADAIRLDVNKRGWLAEVWICLGLDKRPRACPADPRDAAPGDPIKVQAPG